MVQEWRPGVGLIPTDAVGRLSEDGFLLLQLTAAIRQEISATFDAGLQFFRAPLGEKNANRLPGDCGCRPVGIEYSQSPQRPDRIESFSACARPWNPAIALGSYYGRILYDRLLTVIEALEPIAEALTIQIANALGDQSCEKRLRGAFHRWSCLQMNYARPADVLTEFTNEPHEDGHLITIACTTGPGLEIQTAQGSFQPIAFGLDQFVVMPGEIAFLLSGCRIRPLYHCVKCDATVCERMSLLFFGDIDPRLCIPWTRNEVNANVDIGSRVLTNATRFGLHADELD